jgi:predicted anti-sigma-YlaC factor YlaD
VIARLADLGAGERGLSVTRECRRHLARCPSCAAYRQSYRAAVALAREAYRSPAGAERAELPEVLIAEILAAARRRLSDLSPRAWHLVHLLSGIAAGPLLAFYLR